MRNTILLAFLISLSFSLFSAIIEVSVDGTKPYTSIQMAINSSSENDIVRVWPGIYRENINFNHHNITLQSLYPITGDTLDIHNTKIIGNHRDSAIRAQEGVTVIIDGFTIMNNENDEDEYFNWSGGGILVYNSQAIIKNNIYTNLIGFRITQFLIRCNRVPIKDANSSLSFTEFLKKPKIASLKTVNFS